VCHNTSTFRAIAIFKSLVKVIIQIKVVRVCPRHCTARDVTGLYTVPPPAPPVSPPSKKFCNCRPLSYLWSILCAPSRSLILLDLIILLPNVNVKSTNYWRFSLFNISSSVTFSLFFRLGTNITSSRPCYKLSSLWVTDQVSNPNKTWEVTVFYSFLYALNAINLDNKRTHLDI
jgi:hypothetical protein